MNPKSPFQPSRGIGRSRGPDPATGVDTDTTGSGGSGTSTESPVTDPGGGAGSTPAENVWIVRVTGIPSEIAGSTPVTLRDETAAPPAAGDASRVNLVAMIAALATGVRVFLGTRPPTFVIDVTPTAPRPGAEHRRVQVVADKFALNRNGNREAVLSWASMDVVNSSIDVRDPRPVVQPPVERSKGTLILVAGLALVSYAGWQMLTTRKPLDNPSRGRRKRPRNNPSEPCCEECAQGRGCSGGAR